MTPHSDVSLCQSVIVFITHESDTLSCKQQKPFQGSSSMGFMMGICMNWYKKSYGNPRIANCN